MQEIINRSAVIERLRKRHPVPLNVIGILENTDNKGYEDPQTGTVWVENKYFNYITGDARLIKEHLENMPDGFYGFSGVQGPLAKELYKDYFLHWLEPTDRYVCKEHQLTETFPYEMVDIGMEEALGINDRYEYKNEDSLERIRSAISERPTSGIYIEGELASYCLVHEDNSIGYMYTLEKHRHKGLGYWVTLDLLNKMTKLGTTSFVEITGFNYKSQGLAKKTGFEKDLYTPWFGIIKGEPEDLIEWGKTFKGKKMFITLSQLRYNTDQECVVDEVRIEKKDRQERYHFVGKENSYATILINSEEADEDDDTYIVQIDETQGFSTQDILIGLAKHMTYHQAGLIVDYDEQAATVLGCLAIG